MKRIFVQFITDKKFVIVFQSHKSNQFGSMSDTFRTKEFCICSAAMPQVFDNSCYMRGESYTRDADILLSPNDDWKKQFLKTINEYNEYFK